VRRGTRRSSRTSRSVGTEIQGPVSGGSPRSGSLAAAANHLPNVPESRATSPSRSRQACWPDRPHTPGMWPGRWRSGSHIGRRPRRAAVSSCQRALPPRLDRAKHGLCPTPPDGLEPSTHTITIPLYPQSDGFWGGSVALRHRGNLARPCCSRPSHPCRLPLLMSRGRHPACADLRVQRRPSSKDSRVKQSGGSRDGRTASTAADALGGRGSARHATSSDPDSGGACKRGAPARGHAPAACLAAGGALPGAGASRSEPDLTLV
jgi:hypothetical protein